MTHEPQEAQAPMRRAESNLQSCGHPTACVKADTTGATYCAWCKEKELDQTTINDLRDDVAEMQGWSRRTLRPPLKGTVAILTKRF